MAYVSFPLVTILVLKSLISCFYLAHSPFRWPYFGLRHWWASNERERYLIITFFMFQSILLSNSLPRKDPRRHSSCNSIRGRITNNRFISIWPNSSPLAMWRLIWCNRHRSPLLVMDYFIFIILPEFTFWIHSDGVRAGAKRLGRKKQLTDAQKELMLQHRLSQPNPCVVPSFVLAWYIFWI